MSKKNGVLMVRRYWVVYLCVALAAVFSIWFFRDSKDKTPVVSKVKSFEKQLSLNGKICLNMIVKNESKVIRRCLDSVIPFIDYWVIVDTGSTDGTQKIIKDHLKDIPGELHERPWKNFEVNRNEALQLAKARKWNQTDYILFMDADDVLEFDKDFQPMFMTQDLYNMWRGVKGFTYTKPQIARINLPWKWVGVTHEYLGCDEPFSEETLDKVKYVTISDGASAFDNKKYYRNIELLTEGLKKEPNNNRYVFYLAESYRAVGEMGNAVEWYQKVVKMNGWNEEVFWSKLQIGHHLRYMGLPSATVIESYKDAHQFRPHRVEPVYYLAELYNQLGQYDQAYSVIKDWQALVKPPRKDNLFNEDWIADYGLLFQLSICSYYMGRYQESLEICDKVLALQDLPEAIRKQAEINRTFPFEKLKAQLKETKKV